MAIMVMPGEYLGSEVRVGFCTKSSSVSLSVKCLLSVFKVSVKCCNALLSVKKNTDTSTHLQDRASVLHGRQRLFTFEYLIC